MDWNSFIIDHPTFQEVYHELLQSIPRLVLETFPVEADTAGNVILELMLAIHVDCDDVMVLGSNNRFWGALKLLRPLFERTVTLKYLAMNPEEAQAFVDYDAVNWDDILSGIANTTRVPIQTEIREKIAARASDARKRLKQEKCSLCKQRKPVSWTPRSSVELAQKTGLGRLHFEAFVMPSKHIHPTYFGICEVLRSKEEPPVCNILKAVHVLTLEVVLSHLRYFRKDPLAAPIATDAIRDFLKVWTFSETDFGLGADAARAGLAFHEWPICSE